MQEWFESEIEIEIEIESGINTLLGTDYKKLWNFNIYHKYYTSLE